MKATSGSMAISRQKFVTGMLEIGARHIGEAQVEVNVWQIGIELHGFLQLGNRFIVFVAIQRGFAHQHVIFRGVLPQFDEASQRAIFDVRLAGLVRGVAKHVEIIQVVGFLRPERIERLHRVTVSLREKIAEAQQVARLHGLRLVAHH